eukprot:TRINITY_DN457_c0_g1_i1.p1 TRINITY_DN457_c0_g1~~TRINITY_DN457_c0_g1_i1.p1  ORF type:complete len:218 (+),score=30.92 TRINITY_DN457_c0_g1_i1:185-838(+)
MRRACLCIRRHCCFFGEDDDARALHLELQCSGLSAHSTETARKAFVDADTDGDGKLSCDELKKVIVNHPELWAMLEVNTGIETARCQEIATAVAMTKADSNDDGLITWDEFRALWSSVFKQPKSQLEFFQKALFSAFDNDGNGLLDREELATFLDLFYQKGSIFAGDQRLPPKEELLKLCLEELDRNGDGCLSFVSMEPLISGKLSLNNASREARAM